MSRPKKDYCFVSIKMDEEIHSQLEDYCKKTRLTKTAAIENALELMFTKKNRKEKSEQKK